MATSDEVWTAVNAEVADMQRHIGGGTDPLAGFTPAQRTIVRIYVAASWRLAVQREQSDAMIVKREHDELQAAIRRAVAGG